MQGIDHLKAHLALVQGHAAGHLARQALGDRRQFIEVESHFLVKLAESRPQHLHGARHIVGPRSKLERIAGPISAEAPIRFGIVEQTGQIGVRHGLNVQQQQERLGIDVHPHAQGFHLLEGVD